jgi:integrase
MTRSLQRLSPLTVERTKKPGRVHDGGGLYLQVTPTGGKSWVFRYALHGRRPEMGLGTYPEISLAAARRVAFEARSQVKAGQDPIAARDAERARQRLASARGLTFDQAAKQFLEGHGGSWRNKKHRQQWHNTLSAYASPIIGATSVADLTTADVTRVLDQIWKTRPETASRLRARIERILDWAKVRGYRTGENPARWRGHLDNVYPARSEARPVAHHAAVAIDDLPATYAALCQSAGTAALALRFAILTAARAGEVTGATWAEIDLQGKVWTIPASRMKAGREHRVPLSSEAVKILDARRGAMSGDLVFPSWRNGRPLAPSSLLKALRDAGRGSATVHGFRSTFRDWTAERTDTPRDVAEMALAHTIENKAEAAYRRGDMMIKRALLMERWATFTTTPHVQAEVVQFGAAITYTRDAA